MNKICRAKHGTRDSIAQCFMQVVDHGKTYKRAKRHNSGSVKNKC